MLINLSECEGEGDECYVHGDACKAERATEAYIAISQSIYDTSIRQEQPISLAAIQWVITRVLLHPSLVDAIPPSNKRALRPEPA